MDESPPMPTPTQAEIDRVRTHASDPPPEPPAPEEPPGDEPAPAPVPAEDPGGAPALEPAARQRELTPQPPRGGYRTRTFHAGRPQ